MSKLKILFQLIVLTASLMNVFADADTNVGRIGKEEMEYIHNV